MFVYTVNTDSIQKKEIQHTTFLLEQHLLICQTTGYAQNVLH